jgi:hypothetical protein
MACATVNQRSSLAWAWVWSGFERMAARMAALAWASKETVEPTTSDSWVQLELQVSTPLNARISAPPSYSSNATLRSCQELPLPLPAKLAEHRLMSVIHVTVSMQATAGPAAEARRAMVAARVVIFIGCCSNRGHPNAHSWGGAINAFL